jgi:hypothetical protein
MRRGIALLSPRDNPRTQNSVLGRGGRALRLTRSAVSQLALRGSIRAVKTIASAKAPSACASAPNLPGRATVTKRPPRQFGTAMRVAALVSIAFTAGGCPCARSAINNSESLRWFLFSNFGASKVCPEVQKRGVPIKLALVGPASVGRFFPSQCQVQIDDTNRTMVVAMNGTGYVSLPVTKRVGFYAGLAVEYRPDFRLEDDSMYVWGKFSRMLAAPDLRILGVENPIVNLATQTPVGSLGTAIGQGIVTNELGRGFTVVRSSDGDDFSLGLLAPPQKPTRQFQAGDDHVVLGTDYTEVQPQAREYLGPFEVKSNGSALFVKARVQGSPVVMAVVERQVGEVWRQAYESAKPLSPAPGQALGSATFAMGEGTQTIPVGKGTYYVVLENQAPQPFAPLGVGVPFTASNASYVSYAVEVGDR